MTPSYHCIGEGKTFLKYFKVFIWLSLVFLYSLPSLKEKKDAFEIMQSVYLALTSSMLDRFYSNSARNGRHPNFPTSHKSQHHGESADLWCVSDIWLCPEIMQGNLSSKNKQLFYGTFYVIQSNSTTVWHFSFEQAAQRTRVHVLSPDLVLLETIHSHSVPKPEGKISGSLFLGLHVWFRGLIGRQNSIASYCSFPRASASSISL